MPIIPINKPLGWTPLDVITYFRKHYSEYQDQKMSYAGRLDPMAEGVLLLLVGDQKDKASYLALDKEYHFQCALGISTDTFDVMGLIKEHVCQSNWSELDKELERISKLFLGKMELDYPLFSSKTVRGRSLFEYGRLGKVPSEPLPKKAISITSFSIKYQKQLDAKKIIRSKLQIIRDVRGEFRQAEIIDSWSLFFDQFVDCVFPVCQGILSASSGTYVRRVVDLLGQQLQSGAVVTHIKRVRVGSYHISDCIKLK